MRMAAVGYYPSFPVKYSNMYNDYSMVTAGLADPFLPQKKEKARVRRAVAPRPGEAQKMVVVVVSLYL